MCELTANFAFLLLDHTFFTYSYRRLKKKISWQFLSPFTKLEVGKERMGTGSSVSEGGHDGGEMVKIAWQ